MKIEVIKPEEFGLEKKQATTIEEAFRPKIEEREILTTQYGELIKQDIDEQTCAEATSLRRKLVKVRTGISDIHKKQKAFFLAAGKFVDAWKNKETLPVSQMEEGLSKIEKHFEILEEEKNAKIRAERMAELDKYETVYGAGDIALMEDGLYKHFLNGVKSEFEARKAEEKRVELERIKKEKAAIAEQKRIKAENEQLKKEAELKRIADEKVEKERQRLAKIEQDKRDKIERERLAKAEIERKASELKLQKERGEKAKLQRELEAKAEIERKRKETEQLELIRIQKAEKAKEEEIRLLELAPVKDKLKRWIKETEIKDPTNNEMDKETFEIVEDIMIKFNSFKKWATGEIEKIK